MNQILLVAVGGAVGSVARHLVSVASTRIAGSAFPWGTMTVNIVGSFLMGIFIEVLARRLGGSAELRLLVATGFLGGFTTFSSLTLDAAVIFERGEVITALAYVAASVIIGLAALFAGLALARIVA
ncbi:fluoride efflux transporter CrcB [Mangrovicella endophytica]|uniref:fluoride efflux transporter CrcB n=1 Tax=Mangrovicella endophytica TaxID=2066697 RepID=UPI000C9E3183|nr:fluoride efflux transporter CrcB [Mangrovicella endophytica]